MSQIKAGKTVEGADIVKPVFGINGSWMILFGLYILISHQMPDAAGIVLTAAGAALLSAAILMELLKQKKKHKIEQLRLNNKYIMARITSVTLNPTVQYGTVNPYRIRCEYFDEYGKRHAFKSGNILFNPDSEIRGRNIREIKVYVNPPDYKCYEVDVSFLNKANIVNHTLSGYLDPKTANFYIGAVFTAVGVLVCILGAVLFSAVRDPGVFIPTGIIFAAFGGPGMVFLIGEIKKRKIRKTCIRENRCVMAKVTSAALDPTIHVSYPMLPTRNNLQKLRRADGSISNQPYFLQCTYFDANTNTTHIFRSKYLPPNEEENWLGKEVKVFYYGKNMDKYFVELDDYS
jgi:hypothetical protein